MDANQAYLAGRLALVEARVRRLLARKHGAEPLDPLRSLVITRKQVEDMLTETSPAAEEILEADLRAETERLDAEAMSEDGGVDIRLIDLALGLGLSRLDLELLCIALAPDLDGRFGRLFAYLQDDFSARRPTVALALELLDRSALDVVPRSRLQPGSPLVDGGLLSLPNDGAPLLQRRLVVPDRVVMHVLGDDTLDPAVTAMSSGHSPTSSRAQARSATPSRRAAPSSTAGGGGRHRRVSRPRRLLRTGFPCGGGRCGGRPRPWR